MNVSTEEHKKDPEYTRASRPDAIVSAIDQLAWGPSIAFGEVKCAKDAHKHYMLGRDLIRLGIFAKNAIDSGKTEHVICFQAVGFGKLPLFTPINADAVTIGQKITFYTMSLEIDAVYTMTESGTWALDWDGSSRDPSRLWPVQYDS